MCLQADSILLTASGSLDLMLSLWFWWGIVCCFCLLCCFIPSNFQLCLYFCMIISASGSIMYTAVGKTHKHCLFQALQDGIYPPEVFGRCVHHPHGTVA